MIIGESGILAYLKLSNLLPAGVFVAFPVLVVEAAQGTQLPSAIEAQGWLIAVVAVAMGLVKIALWLRGYKDGGPPAVDFSKVVENLSLAIDKLVENDQKLSENQQTLGNNQIRLSENQTKALENHNKILELINVIRFTLQAMEGNIVNNATQRAGAAAAEVKEVLNQQLFLLKSLHDKLEK